MLRSDKYIYAACAGAIGGLSVLFGSCTGKSINCDSCSFGEAFTHLAFYGYVLAMLACVMLQTHLLNKAMQLGGTMSVFPVFEVAHKLSAKYLAEHIKSLV